MIQLLERIQGLVKFGTGTVVISRDEAQSLLDLIKALEEYNELLVKELSDSPIPYNIRRNKMQELSETIFSIKAKTF